MGVADESFKEKSPAWALHRCVLRGLKAALRTGGPVTGERLLAATYLVLADILHDGPLRRSSPEDAYNRLVVDALGYFLSQTEHALAIEREEVRSLRVHVAYLEGELAAWRVRKPRELVQAEKLASLHNVWQKLRSENERLRRRLRELGEEVPDPPRGGVKDFT
jgi:hypothetical protein